MVSEGPSIPVPVVECGRWIWVVRENAGKLVRITSPYGFNEFIHSGRPCRVKKKVQNTHDPLRRHYSTKQI